jgi:hypothetical protein
MTTTKVYKTMIGARMAIMMGKIKSFFKGSHYVAETYTLKFDKTDKVYIVEHYTMTHDEERQFHEALKIKQQEIEKMAKEILTNEPVENPTKTEAPKMNAKPKQTAKPKTQKPNTTNVTQKTASDKPKKKYYYNSNSNKKKSTPKSNGAQQ